MSDMLDDLEEIVARIDQLLALRAENAARRAEIASRPGGIDALADLDARRRRRRFRIVE